MGHTLPYWHCEAVDSSVPGQPLQCSHGCPVTGPGGKMPAAHNAASQGSPCFPNIAALGSCFNTKEESAEWQTITHKEAKFPLTYTSCTGRHLPLPEQAQKDIAHVFRLHRSPAKAMTACVKSMTSDKQLTTLLKGSSTVE